MQLGSLFMVMLVVLAVGSALADESDYVPNPPLTTGSSLNGDMFTNETEILTPRGIIDEPPAPMILTQDTFPEVTQLSPAAGPDVSATAPVSPTAP